MKKLKLKTEDQCSKEKCCPKNSFLTLCSDGWIKDAPKGLYTSSNKNKKYAITALDLIKEDETCCHSKSKLWLKVMKKCRQDQDKQYNQQMDVIIVLYQEGYTLLAYFIHKVQK